MSTTYSSSYNYRSNYTYRAALTVNTTSTSTSVTISWTIAAQAQHGYLYGIGIKGGGAISGSASGYFPSGKSPGSTWTQVPNAKKTGSFTVKKTTSSQTKKLTATAYGTIVNGIGSAGGSGVSTSQTITIPALASYKITYNANGGSGAPSSQTKYYGVDLKITTSKPTRAGYIFKGWALTSGGGVYYTSGSTCKQNKALTLYAVWEANKYTITYKPNGGTGGPTSQTKIHGQNLTITDKIPAYTGYDFKEWNTKADGTGTRYLSGGSYTTNASITLYAQWKIKTYDIIYNKYPSGATIGNMPSNTSKNYGENIALSLNKPTRDGYIFKGWATSSDSNVVKFTPGATYKDNAKLNLYTVWEEITDKYIEPEIIDLECLRYDVYGEESPVGDKIKLIFFAKQAKDIVDNVISNRTTHIVITYSANGTSYNNYNSYIANDEKIETSFITNASYFKIYITNIDAYKATTDTTVQEDTSYYIRNAVNSKYYYTLVSNPTGNPKSQGWYVCEENKETEVINISNKKPEASEEYEKKSVIEIKECKRNFYSSELGTLKFTYTPYYDGNIGYLTGNFYIYYRYLSDDNTPTSGYIFTNNTQHFDYYSNGYYNAVKEPLKHDVEFNLSSLPVDQIVEVIIRVESYDANSNRYPENSEEYIESSNNIIARGGFILHVNESGEGMAIFGATTQNSTGLLVNSTLQIVDDTTLNKNLIVNGETTLNNSLKIDNLNSTININVGKIQGFYPIGSIVCMGSETNPSAYYGGTWQLVDKKLKSRWISSGFFTWNNTNTQDGSSTKRSMVAILNGNTIEFRLHWYNKVAASDTALIIGVLDFSKVGITNRHDQYFYGWADGLNAVLLLYLSSSSGKLIVYDYITRAASYPSGTDSSVYANWVTNERYTSLDSEFCDKFYYQRIA